MKIPITPEYYHQQIQSLQHLVVEAQEELKCIDFEAEGMIPQSGIQLQLKELYYELLLTL